MTQNAPPLNQPLLDASGQIPMQWILFFNQIYYGDAGQEWIPTFNSLTIVGATPQVDGRVYQLSKYLTMFTAKITPGTNTSAVAGTTFIDNFPFIMQGDGIVFAVSGRLGSSSGMCEKASNKIWVPGWTTVTVPLTLVGIVEAS